MFDRRIALRRKIETSAVAKAMADKQARRCIGVKRS